MDIVPGTFSFLASKCLKRKMTPQTVFYVLKDIPNHVVSTLYPYKGW